MTPDPFYETMRKFLRGEVTWEEMERVNHESLAAWNQRRALRYAACSDPTRTETFVRDPGCAPSEPQITPNV